MSGGIPSRENAQWQQQTQLAALLAMPGGRDLVDWYGEAPGFHDGEVVGLRLETTGSSELMVHFWRLVHAEGFSAGVMRPDDDRLITFAIEEVLDVELLGFHPHNWLWGLEFRPAVERPDRRPHYPENHCRMIWKS